jgi:hypothetical protein
VVHLEDAEQYSFVNAGRKCQLIARKNGEILALSEKKAAPNRISTSGLFSELIVELER